MRPTKNIVYCCACHKSKMLFKTKSKADNFIKYNSKEILEENGKTPARCYYCAMCGGYHLTSNSSRLSAAYFEKRDKKRMDEILSHKGNETDETLNLIKTIYDRLQTIRTQLNFGISEESKELLELCRTDIRHLANRPIKNKEKLIRLNTAIAKTEKLHNLVDTVSNLTEEGLQPYLDIKDPDEEQYLLKNIIKNIIAIKRVRAILSHIDEMLDKKQINVIEGFNECKELLSTIRGKGRKRTIAYYHSWIDNQKKRIKVIRSITEKNKNEMYFH